MDQLIEVIKPGKYDIFFQTSQSAANSETNHGNLCNLSTRHSQLAVVDAEAH